MSASINMPSYAPIRRWFPIRMLLRAAEPRLVALTLAAGLALGALEMSFLKFALWQATATVLVCMLLPGVRQWRADWRRYGMVAGLLSILLFMQGFHAVEHFAQVAEYHLLNWTARNSTGLLSAANAEWVHFVWNWLVVAVVSILILGGMRNRWAWLMLAWSLLHSLEHTYMFVRYLSALDELRQLGVTNVTAQGLPGFFGRDGWLASSPVTQNTFLCRLPGVTSAPRLDIHFWWNAGETVLLLLAGNSYCANVLVGKSPEPKAASPAA